MDDGQITIYPIVGRKGIQRHKKERATISESIGQTRRRGHNWKHGRLLPVP